MSRVIAHAALVALCVTGVLSTPSAQGSATHYVRYAVGNSTSYGILEGDTIRELKGDLFQDPQPSGRTRKLSQVKLLLPLDPMKINKVIGVAGNAAAPPPAARPTIANPIWFAKFTTGLVGDGSEVETFPESTTLTWEGELVLVIGKKARLVSVEDAPSYIFGVAVGNDVTELDWYLGKEGAKAPGLLASKAADTWSGLGTSIVRGLDYQRLRITVKQNGVLMSDGSTADLINNPAQLVSNISRYVTLLPGDLIYTGNPRRLNGGNGKMVPGDVVEIEIENVGKLTQKVVPLKAHGGVSN